MAIHMSPSGHHAAAIAAQAAAAQTATLGQLKEKMESTEPPQKKMMMVAEEQQKIMENAFQQNLIAMATQLPLNIKVNNRGEILSGRLHEAHIVLFILSLCSLGLIIFSK